MAGWPNLHRPFCDINVGQLPKLVIHAGQFLLHVISRLVRNVEIGAAMFGAATFLRFGVDGARHYVPGGQLHFFPIVTLHESLAVFVAQYAAFAAHCFSHQDSLNARRPNHTRGMKLHKLHIHQLSTRIVSQRHAIAGVFPRV